MRTIATAVLVGALALWGCGEGSSNGKSGRTTDAKSQGAPGSGTRTNNQSSAGTPGTGTQAPSVSAEDLDRSTAEGTLGLFILHMQQGEFADALMLTDPESSGYPQVEQAVNVLAEASRKAEQGITLEALMRAFMSRGWLGAVYEPLTVQEERARFELKLVNHDLRTLDLRKIDGDWYVVAPDWIIVPSDISDLVPDPEESPAAQPAPEPGSGDGEE